MIEIGQITSKELPVFRNLMRDGTDRLILESKNSFALGITEDDLACGAIVVRMEDEAANIESLFVHPSRRRRGFATELVLWAARAAEEREDMLELRADFAEEAGLENGLKEFFSTLEFRIDETEDMGTYELKAEQLFNHPLLKGNVKHGVKPLSQLSSMESRRFLMEEQQFFDISQKRWDALERDISVVTLSKDDSHYNGIVLFEKDGDDLVMIWARGEKGNPAGLLEAIKGAVKFGEEKYGSDQRILIPCVNQQSLNLLKKMMKEDCKKTETYYQAVFPLV